MAKKTKVSNLSIEERLEQALIPNWDEPYKLPENWCWTKIGVITDLYRGVSYKKHEGHSEKGINDCLVMRGGNIQEGKIDTDTDNIYVDKKLVSEEQYVKKHDVVIVSSTGSTKVIGRAGISFADYDDVAFGAFLTLVRPNESVHKPYVSYYFQSIMYRNRMRQLASGVNINNIRNEYITDTPIPLPPLNEQKRIVSHIEALFAKLDEAKEKAQEVVDGFETRKAAILHKAFSGELTAKWRANRDVSDSWETKKLSDVAHLQTGLMKGKKFNGDTVFMPYLRVANVQDGYLDLNEVKTIEVSKANYERYLLRKGDVLFTEGGDYDKLGRGTVWNDEIPNCLHQNHIFVVRVDTHCLMPDFLSYQAGSQYGKKYFMSCAKQTTNLASINSTQLKNFPVILPTLDEQQEIVRILTSMLAKEKRAKEAAEAVLEQIDRQKKAILALAFRGELGTNDPVDESAVELLKRII